MHVIYVRVCIYMRVDSCLCMRGINQHEKVAALGRIGMPLPVVWELLEAILGLAIKIRPLFFGRV